MKQVYITSKMENSSLSQVENPITIQSQIITLENVKKTEIDSQGKIINTKSEGPQSYPQAVFDMIILNAPEES